ncbi:hypothetical protein ACIQXI_16515 [Lysinibacillus sp. NPDC097195]|uniref:hypothetical protein n=1 Tax=Lysinibacillus sp. NPDC097195 TaxID=3364141 RepID=UPI0038147A6F
MKKVFLLMSIFALFLAGCSNVNKNSLEVEDNKENFPPSMTGWVHVDGKKYEIEAGGYRWERRKGLSTETVLTDHASPNQVAENLDAIPLEPSTNIQVEIEENPTINVYLWNEDGREKGILLHNDEIIAPISKGRYVYEVFAQWSNGEVSYTFVVEVK